MNILITGGTGSLGSHLTRYFLAQGHQVTVLSRNAHKQAELAQELDSSKLKLVLGDICDPTRVSLALRGQEVVIHAAAQKRIERGETDQAEYLRINVLGSQVVADQALKQGIAKCLFVSTDKAVSPVNFYGCTKALAERYWLSQGKYSRYSRFGALRYGNVLGSNGSVWHKWQKQLAQGIRMDVRDPEPTRFILNLDQATSFIKQALDVLGREHVLFVPGNLEAFSVWDLAYELEPDQRKWNLKCLGPGEKQHEILVAPGEDPYQVSPDLWSLHWGFENQDKTRFYSDTARRISGHEISLRLGKI